MKFLKRASFGGRVNEEFKINRCTLLYIKWTDISNKDLLQDRRNLVTCSDR